MTTPTHQRRRRTLATPVRIAIAGVLIAMLSGCYAEGPFGGYFVTPDKVIEGMLVGISYKLDPKQQAIERRRHRREASSAVTTNAGLALLSYLHDHGRWPAHPAALVAQGYARVDDWKLPDERVRFGDIAVGPTTLTRLPEMPFKKRDRAIAEAEQALPEHAVAMRLGDLVFTYLGAPCTDGVAGLWLVVLLPHPELDGREQVWCASAPECRHLSLGGYSSNGHTQEFDASELPQRLKAQNAFRAKLGLPPLPDPGSIPHGGVAAAASLSPPALDEWSVQRQDHGLWADTPEEKAGAVALALEYYARDHDGREPAHAAALVAEAYLDPSALIDSSGATDPSRVPIGPATLASLPSLTAGERLRAVQAAADALPQNVIAYRLGDCVFTYQGIDLENRHAPGLWVAVLCRDPEVNGPQDPLHPVHACTGHAQVESWYRSLPRVIDRQNRQRADVGLPPLPDPTTVTQGAPAVAEPP